MMRCTPPLARQSSRHPIKFGPPSPRNHMGNCCDWTAINVRATPFARRVARSAFAGTPWDKVVRDGMSTRAINLSGSWPTCQFCQDDGPRWRGTLSNTPPCRFQFSNSYQPERGGHRYSGFSIIWRSAARIGTRHSICTGQSDDCSSFRPRSHCRCRASGSLNGRCCLHWLAPQSPRARNGSKL
jgi:hypothetical protein